MTDEIGARIRALSETVSAPAPLRVPRKSSRRPLAAVGATLAAAVTAVVLVMPGSPSVAAVADVALDRPERSAPVGSDYLPGFKAIGARTDEIDGRRAETVIYTRGDVGIHYTVVDGDPLDLPDGRRVRAAGRDLVLARDGDVSIVAWYAYGKTCVLASRNATPDEVAATLS